MGGTYINSTRKRKRGMKYIRVCAGPQRHRYVHDLVAEALLRRPLRENEVPDHKDGDTFNNHPTNIQIVTVPYNSKRKYGRKHQKPLPLEIVLDGAEVFEREPGCD